MNRPKPMSQYDIIRRAASAFEHEVPEYRQGEIRIVAVASQPGVRTKVAVDSANPQIDPVGVCVGPQGSRIRAIVERLGGERLDIVPYADEPVRYVCNALAPVEIKRVLIDEESRVMELIVEDDQLERAVGDGGLQLRLAASLTQWRLDLFAESRIQELQSELRTTLADFPPELVDHLILCGYDRKSYLATARAEELVQYAGVTPDQATTLLAAARTA